MNRLKKISASALFFLLSITVTGQYCNERFDFNNEAEVGFSIVEDDSGFVVCAAKLDSLNYPIIALVFYDTSCNVRHTKSYGKTYNYYYPGIGGSFINTTDGGFAVGGGIRDSINVRSALLMKFFPNGDTAWTKRFYYDAEDFITAYQVKQTSDSGFILVGMANPGLSDDVLLIKTDNLGNEQWRQLYGTSLIEYGFHIMVTSDGSYLVGGQKCDIPCTPDDGDMMVMKISSSGALLWQKQYGNPIETENGAVVGHEFPDGSFLIGGNYGYTQGRKMAVYRIDSNGNQIWKVDLTGFNPSNAAVQSIKTINDTVALIGGFFADWPGGNSGIIAKVDINGNLLLKRDLDYDKTTDYSDYFNDVIITSSGTYAATGVTNDGSQDIWFVTLDEYACLEPDCWKYDEHNYGLEPSNSYYNDIVELEDKTISIFPNPANDYVTVSSSEIIYQIEIIDVTGKRMKILTENSREAKIFLDFDNGIYFFRITTDEGNYTRRLIKY
jgi:hypothetical protein